MTQDSPLLWPALERSIAGLQWQNIAPERQARLQGLVEYLQSKQQSGDRAQLHFICTHNSRRSHLAQAWAQALAAYHGLNVQCYSGGTAVTAVYPQVLVTLSLQGFRPKKRSAGSNPHYQVSFAKNAPPLEFFSKLYSDAHNPRRFFAAIMTCTQADTDCPLVAGAEMRLALPYQDPKAYDHSEQKAAQYAARSLQIAAELQYVYQQIKTT